MFEEFCQKSKPIFISLSPNTEKDDILLALKVLLRPWQWRRGKAIAALEAAFKRYSGLGYAYSFNSGRSAFLAILSALELEKDSQVLIQALTCNALVNPVIWSGLKPVFVDINPKTLNMDLDDLEKKITRQSKAIVVQHTFGLAGDIEKVLEICRRRNLILVEDCAHSLGATYHGRKVGGFGRASFFSFGRDKIISSVYGGMAATNDKELARKIESFRHALARPSSAWTAQQLLHPILVNFFIIPLYSFFGLGRLALGLSHRLKILSKAVSRKEKKGRQPDFLPQKMANGLAVLAVHQLGKLGRYLSHQREIAGIYREKLSSLKLILPKENSGRVYLRYPLLLNHSQSGLILKLARRKKIFLNDGWRQTPIAPPDTDQAKMGYRLGDCPQAERAAKCLLNLPVHINISAEAAERIVAFLQGNKSLINNDEFRD
jgi:dTDP-4-amino-4,6-dideoxygalactose transaminase